MTQESVLKQVAELPTLSFAELKERWRALYGAEPPAYNRTYLVKRLAYRIQELAYGGLSESAKARLREVADADDMGTRAGKIRRRSKNNGIPVIGTRLIREYEGTRHEAIVVAGGFEYQGRKYRSLSAIAREITGTQWNGPSFFGLRHKRGSASR